MMASKPSPHTLSPVSTSLNLFSCLLSRLSGRRYDNIFKHAFIITDDRIFNNDKLYASSATCLEGQHAAVTQETDELLIFCNCRPPLARLACAYRVFHYSQQ